MGVYIEGASIPKNCEECNFKVVCKPYWKRIREQYTRPTWCPCIELTMQYSIVGEWKWESEDICDNCGCEIPHLERIVGDVVVMDSKDWKYCPNCGAKMKGAEE